MISDFVKEFKETADSPKSSVYSEEADKYLTEAYLTLGTQHSMVNDFTNAEELLKNAAELSQAVKEFTDTGEINYQLGMLHKRKWEQKLIKKR